jgi:hypothetical protein
VLAVLLLVNFFAFPTSIRADSPIFKYEDDSGIITFTEQWDSIPIKYRVVLKFVVVAVVGGTGYLLYFSILNAEVSISNGEPRRPTTTIDDFMQTLRNLHAPLSYDIDNSVLHPIQSVIEQSKDATVGKASRTVNQSNAATTQMEDTLKETEVDQAQVDGQ